MNNMPASVRGDPDKIYRLLGGWRKKIARDRRLVSSRRLDILKYLVDRQGGDRTSSRELAAVFGVTMRTIQYDIKAITEEMNRCRSCGQPLPHVSRILLEDDPQLGSGSAG